MKFFITGAAGFIGSNLCHLLHSKGHSIVAYDALTYAGNPLSVANLKDCPGFRFIRGDICDGSQVKAILDEFKPDSIMHLAAESHVDRSIEGPDTFIQSNIVGTFRLLQAARVYFNDLSVESATRFRLHHISTDEVFGSLTPGAPPFSETSPYDPHSPYSASKAASDHLVRAWYTTYGLPVLITNCSNNYGPYQFPEKLIPVVILKCLRGEPIPVYGLGENIRDWLFVEDHCKALELVVTKGKVGQTYNIGGDNEMRNIDLVRLLCNQMDDLSPQTVPIVDGRPGKHSDLIRFVSDRPGHDMRYAIDATKIRNELNWRPIESAATGFRKTVQWYLSNQSWLQSVLTTKDNLHSKGLETR